MSKKQKSKLVVEALETRVLPAADSVSALIAAALPSYSVDGSGNNLTHALWGSAGSDLLRGAPPRYADGVSAMVGANLPSGRAISNALGTQADDVLDNRNLSAFIYAWGQFIDHDIDHTPDGGASAPIAVPSGDPQFDPAGTGSQTLPFTRSLTDPATGTSKSNPLNQFSDVTAFIDGSMIYGSDAARAAALRTFTGGKLKMSDGDMPSLNAAGLPNANDGPFPDVDMFLGGDIRANENVELTALTTVFMREHNYWADQIAAAHPAWSDERIFQAARSIVIAEIQSITYNEYLPALLGQGAIDRYQGYNPRVNPGIAAEFSEAAFRFGHSQLDDDVQFMTADGANFAFTYTLPDGTQVPVNTADAIAEGENGMSLVEAFFNPYAVAQPGAIDGILKYLASDVSQAVDGQMVDAVRNILFGAPGSGAGGQDLFALDVQRGRDVGLPTFNQARVAYGLPPAKSFAQISSDPQVQQQLESLYGDVNKVELFVGGLVEDHAPGSSVGATFGAIIADQFERLRDGDRLWYQNVFRGAALSTIQNTTLADVIQRNEGNLNLQKNVFVFRASIAGNVFADGNGDGRLNPRENGVGGVQVNLIEATTGEVLEGTTTNSRGDYRFDVESAGAYQIQLVLADGSRFTAPAASDVSISTGDQFVRQVNFGLQPNGGRHVVSTSAPDHKSNAPRQGGGPDSGHGGDRTAPHALAAPADDAGATAMSIAAQQRPGLHAAVVDAIFRR